MSIDGFSLILLFLLAAGVSAAIIGLSAIIGRKKGPRERAIPYECGLDPVGKPRARASLKFFLVAVLFIIFDVEVVFLYPWAIVFKDFVRQGQGVLMFAEMAVFLGILALGFLYVWGRGALEWEE